jgi:hypothetical protein
VLSASSHPLLFSDTDVRKRLLVGLRTSKHRFLPAVPPAPLTRPRWRRARPSAHNADATGLVLCLRSDAVGLFFQGLKLFSCRPRGFRHRGQPGEGYREREGL